MAVTAGHPSKLLVRLNHRVCRIQHDDLVELVLSILAYPIRVEYLEVRVAPVDSLLCHPLNRLGHCDLLDAGLGRLALHVDLALAQSTSAYAGPNDNNSLLGLVANPSGRVDAGGSLDSLEHRLSPPARHAVAPIPRW